MRRSRFSEEMGYSVQRTGYTAFVNETADLGVALVTPKGEIFGYPSGIGITTFVNLDMSDAFGAFDAYDEGDIVVTNDPYTSGAMSSHLPDVNVFRPVFHDGELVCFTFAYVHSTDVGGNVAGSLTPSNGRPGKGSCALSTSGRKASSARCNPSSPSPSGRPACCACCAPRSRDS